MRAHMYACTRRRGLRRTFVAHICTYACEHHERARVDEFGKGEAAGLVVVFAMHSSHAWLSHEVVLSTRLGCRFRTPLVFFLGDCQTVSVSALLGQRVYAQAGACVCLAAPECFLPSLC